MDTDVPPSAPRSSRGYHWVPTLELEPGMVIARPVLGHSGVRATILLAEGSAITASTIAQLINKAVECVAVRQDSPSDQDSYARLLSQYEARLHEIFGPDPDENCRPLLEVLIADGPP